MNLIKITLFLLTAAIQGYAKDEQTGFLRAMNVELAGSCCGCDGGVKAVKTPCSSNSECLSGCCEKESGKCGNCKGCPSFAKKCMPCVPGESEEEVVEVSDESEDEVVEVSDESEEEVIEVSDESEEDSEDSEDMDSTATNKFLEAINVELAGSCCGCDGGAKAVKVPTVNV